MGMDQAGFCRQKWEYATKFGVSAHQRSFRFSAQTLQTELCVNLFKYMGTIDLELQNQC